MHKHQSHHTRHGCQRTGWYLHNAFFQCPDQRFLRIRMRLFFHKTMEQNNRIINCHSKLQNGCYCIGNKRNLSEYKVGTHIQECRHGKYKHENSNLHIGSWCKPQNSYNNKYSDHQNDLDIFLQWRIIIFIYRRVKPGIIIGQCFPHIFDCTLCFRIIFRCVKSNTQKCGQIFVIIRQFFPICNLCLVLITFLIKVHRRYALDVFELFYDILRFFIRYIWDHNLCRTKGRELSVHQINSLSGLSVFWKIICQFLYDFHMGWHDGTTDRCRDKDHHQQLTIIYNKFCQLSQVFSSSS